MSRWQTEFENHPFQASWSELKLCLEEITVDDGIEQNITEFARLKKVITFIDELITTIDLEFLPQTTWQNFDTQCKTVLKHIKEYIRTKSSQYIVTANTNVDALLTYICPYVIDKKAAAKSTRAAYKKYATEILNELDKFKNKADEYIESFKDYETNTKDEYEKLQTIHAQISELKELYFDGTADEDSLDVRINELFANISKYKADINDYHMKLLGDDDSIQSKIELAQSEAEENSESITKLLKSTKQELESLKEFHEEIMGQKDEDGNFSGGLKEEIIVRQKALDTFKTNQEIRYKTLNKQIEDLLPGATSAGLASAYQSMKTSFNKPIRNASVMFYISIVLLFAIALIPILTDFLLSGFKFTSIDITDYKNLLSSLTHKMPFILPTIWLAIVASKRRSEAQRLQQEYAHKEALTMSYQSFKKQIDELQSDQKDQLSEKLLSAAINTVAFNASESLDKKHGDKTPVHEWVEKSFGLIEKFLEFVKKK